MPTTGCRCFALAAAIAACGDASSPPQTPSVSTDTAGMAAPSAGTSGSPAPSAGSTSAASAGTGGAGGVAAPSTAGTGGAAGAVEGVGGSGGVSGSAAQAGSSGQAGEPAALGDAQTLIPDASWSCGMPGGIPGPAAGEHVFDIDFTVAEVREVGVTHYGQRLQIDVSGGSVDGPELQAELLDRGLDYQLTLENGVVELEQVHMLRAGSAAIYMRNCGVAPGPGNVRVVLDFEAPSASAVAWLNTGTYVGTREFDAAAKTLRMRVYSMSGAVDTTDAVHVVEPDAAPDQSWECAEATGSQGEVVYTESVGIGAGSIAVGASKRGTRNVIPITGGTTSGRVEGGVLSGGADFQLSSGGVFTLDARYTLLTDDGELIIVRNCGPIGALVPVFEARADGPYAFLNANTFLSSNPGIGLGAVNLTIYERR